MIQVIVFFIALGVLIASGANILGAIIGGIVISFIGSLVLAAISVWISNKS